MKSIANEARPVALPPSWTDTIGDRYEGLIETLELYEKTDKGISVIRTEIDTKGGTLCIAGVNHPGPIVTLFCGCASLRAAFTDAKLAISEGDQLFIEYTGKDDRGRKQFNIRNLHTPNTKPWEDLLAPDVAPPDPADNAVATKADSGNEFEDDVPF